jgi:hypothetical protein
MPFAKNVACWDSARSITHFAGKRQLSWPPFPSDIWQFCNTGLKIISFGAKPAFERIVFVVYLPFIHHKSLYLRKVSFLAL